MERKQIFISHSCPRDIVHLDSGEGCNPCYAQEVGEAGRWREGVLQLGHVSWAAGGWQETVRTPAAGRVPSCGGRT